MNSNVTIIVLGGSTNALGQIRAAAAAGFKCINIVEKCIHRFSTKSNKCKGYVSPHPFKERAECMAFTLNIISQQPNKPYLFFASDEWMDMVGENEAIFKEVAHLIQSPWAETVQLYNKKYLYRLAEEYEIPYPKTIELDSLKQLEDALNHITLPCVVKPQVTVDQNEVKDTKVKVYHRTQSFETKDNALMWVRSMLDNGLDFPVLLQEYIPGDATNLYTLTSYSDKSGNLVAGSIGHKLRQFPPEAGRITSGVLQYEENLKEVAERLLKAVRFNGVANTEFKYDARDGKYKLMEINTRFGAWNYSTLYSGINLMKIAVDDYNGERYSGPQFRLEKEGYIWYNFAQDFGGAVILCRKEQFKKHKLSIGQWKRSIGKNHFEAVFKWSDPLPFICECWYLLVDMI